MATITALKTTDSFGVAERRHALGLLPHSEAPLEPRMVQEVLGCVPTSPEEAMPLMTFPVLPDAEAERRLWIVERAIGQSIDDRAGWIGRLQHGAKLYSVRSLLNRMIRDDLLPAIAPAPKRPREAAYESNANAVTEALAAGRNVILMGYHGNSPPMLGPINRYIADHQIPTIIVGNAAERRTPPGGLYIHTLAPDFVVQFAKVAKALKTGGPRVITIMPDGGIGGSFRTFDLAGAKARMGLGAASLAFFGKAKGFLCHPHMVGDRIACRYLPCFDVSAEDSKEAVSDHLTAAYRDGFISLLRGDPACFGLAGNYWSILYRPED